MMIKHAVYMLPQIIHPGTFIKQIETSLLYSQITDYRFPNRSVSLQNVDQLCTHVIFGEGNLNGTAGYLY